MIRERERNGLPGIPVLLLLFLAWIAATGCCSRLVSARPMATSR